MRVFDLCRAEIASFLREPLVSSEQWERAARRGRSLPGAFSAFYLECRLSPPGPELDLLACVRWSEEHSESFAASRGDANPAVAFVSRWLFGVAATDCPLIWLELDDAAPAGSSPFSNLHVCLDSQYLTRPGACSDTPESQTTQREAAARLAAELLQARLLTRPQLDRLKRSITSLPTGGRLVHVSAMAARHPVELKLYLALPEGAVMGFLTSVLDPEWVPRLAALTPWLDRKLHGSVVYCDLTFRGNGCKSVGLVFSQPQIAELGDDAGRRTVRERLVREGLCTLAQDAALEAWMQHPVVQPMGQHSPRALSRWLDLKVTLGPSRLASKAYLGFAPVPLVG
jgi:hypothetical protein